MRLQLKPRSSIQKVHHRRSQVIPRAARVKCRELPCRSMKTAGDHLPGFRANRLGGSSRLGILDQLQNPFAFRDDDFAVRRAVVFVEAAMLCGLFDNTLQPLSPVLQHFVVRKQLAGRRTDPSAKYRNVRVAGADVALPKGCSGVTQSILCVLPSLRRKHVGMLNENVGK